MFLEAKNAGSIIEPSFAETVRYTARRIITKTQFKRRCEIPSGYRLYLGAGRPGEFFNESRKLQRGCKLAHQLREHYTGLKFTPDKIPERIVTILNLQSG